MPILTEVEMTRRRIVLRDRLDETRFIRGLKLRPETAEVWMVIAKGYYGGYPVNVAGVVKRTGMDKATVRRHAELLANEPIPMVTITHRGQDTILRVTDEALTDKRVMDYFDFRYQELVNNAEELKKHLDC
jgi:hypothetical protein